MTDFSPGQRWINNAEPDLGLGTVIEVEHRTVTMLFVAAEETRVYAKQNTPLSRIQFSIGEVISSQGDGEITVTAVHEEEGLLIYRGNNSEGVEIDVPETRLDHFLQLTGARERLLSEQLDKDIWFELRSKTLVESNRLTHSDLLGLSGCRTSLIPHQLYIAHEVGKRYAPRVLLADEVGLGKTIEAGMILHQQLLRGQAGRVLIVVPETLQHQWLVEMLRRFNLRFSLFDSDRFLDAIETDPESNPLMSSQLVLCSLDFLIDHPTHSQAALAGEWDLLIVDEAHHLQWSPEQPDPAYVCIESLSQSTAGVLLLTATPEQLGKESHFARLRLLDPGRFSDFQQFQQEEDAYQPVAEIIETLLSEKELNPGQINKLEQLLPEFAIDKDKTDTISRQKIISHLLDHQGTGRILFRNTRASVKGFPERIVSSYELEKPSAYSSEQLLSPTPEQDCDEWTEFDPRIDWLFNFLKRHPEDKALLITADARTALDIAQTLRVKRNIHAAVFHEGMSILERDKAAAFFADVEDGSQLLLCSEIGGEGRNFQFASHLILFDLPVNPDLLEQRIGRIDRIGQGDEIFIHVPYIKSSAQEVLYRWYFEALEALQRNCPAAQTVYQKYKKQLSECFASPEEIDEFISSAHSSTEDLNEKLQDGRDKLLELNSFRPVIADSLIAQLVADEDDEKIESYMSMVFDCFGVEQQVHSEKAYVLHPGSTMVEAFPGLPDEGTTITFNRDIALKYEDIEFINWEHDMVSSIMENILLNEKGNVSMTTIKHPAIAANTLMLECLFVLDVIKEVRSYLPGTIVRTVISEDKKNYSKALSAEMIDKVKEPVKKNIAKKIIKAKKNELEKLLKLSSELADKQTDELSHQAKANADQVLNTEAQRLKSLQAVNPNVRDEEIRFFENKYALLTESLSSPSLRLDAVRILVAT